jgi:sulfonate transport system permease protein
LIVTDQLVPNLLVSLFRVSAGLSVGIAAGTAIRGTDRKLLEAAGMLGLSAREVIWHVLLPSALPGFLVGLRQALGIAWISLVVAEQINATSGIGYLVMNAQEFLQTDVTFDGLLVYAALGLATDRLVRSLEHRLLAWRPALLAN